MDNNKQYITNDVQPSLPNQKHKQKQRNLIVIQNQQKLNELKSNIKQIVQQLNDTKDTARKYRQKLITSLALNPDQSWVYNPQSVFCLNSGSFFHQIPINKLIPYFESRTNNLTKLKRQKQDEKKRTLHRLYEMVKQQSISKADLNSDTYQMLKQYLQELEDYQND